MRRLLQDVRFSFRVFAGSPAFASVAILTLGLGIACTTTVFSWIDALLLHPYPGTARSEELVWLETHSANAPNGGTAISWQDFRDYRSSLKTLSGLAIRRQCAFTLGDGQTPRLTWGELVSGNYFDVMGVQPILGRTFTADESSDTPDAHPVMIVSQRLWRSFFHSDPAIVGKTVRVNRHGLTIVGVVPSAFRGTSPVMQYDLWTPVTMAPSLGLLPPSTFKERGQRGMLGAVGRLRPGTSFEQARAEAAALAANLTATYPKTNQKVTATILRSWEQHNGVNEYLRAPLSILLAVAFVVLLIVCANVANLLLTRAVGREREFGIRFALGASRPQVVAQILSETLILSIAGAVAGFLMLLWMQGSLLAMVPSVGFPFVASDGLNARVLAFTALTCGFAALIAGVSPALFVFHSNLNDVLKEGGRSDSAGAASRRMRGVLVIGEVALAMVALVGAGLFVRSFRNVRAVHPGFQADHVLFGRFFIETADYTGDQIQQFSTSLKDRLLQTSGVEAVSYTDFVPLSTTAGPYNYVQVDGYTPARGENPSVNRALVSPDYFATMQIPIVAGRDFNVRDDRTAEPVIIVNQSFSRLFFRGADPLGRKVQVAGKVARVVGLAHDSKYFTPAETPAPHFYLPFIQFYGGSPELYFLVRTTGQPLTAIPLLRRVVLETDSNATAFHAVPLAEYTAVATFGEKAAASLMGTLGIICLLLAALGLYGVMSYSVSQRIPEIGIRMAMGARPANVIAMIVSQGMALAIVGLSIGVVAALATTRLVATMLFGVDASDPVTFLLAALFLGAVALAATFLPAFRATRMDPLSALRR